MDNRKFKESPEKVIRMVNKGILPQRLFCYQRFDPDEHTIDILRNKELYFAHRDQLNDPFEFKVYPKIVKPDYIIKNAPEVCFNETFTREDLRNKLTEEDAAIFIRQAINSVMGNKGFKCFTPYPDNLLMWSHYAQSHTGLCLEFDVLESPEFFSYPIKVLYKENYPTLDFSKEDDRYMIYSVKSHDWAYEDEFRILKLKSQCYPFNPIILKSIIFGCRASIDNIQKVIDIITNSSNLGHVKLKIAEPDRYSFRINIKDFTR